MRTARWCTLLHAVSLLTFLLIPAIAMAQSPLPPGGPPPIYLPVVAGGPATTDAADPEPLPPAPSEPPAEVPVVTPAPEPEETSVDAPPPVDNPDAFLFDTNGPLYESAGEENSAHGAVSPAAPAWNVNGDYTISGRLGVGMDPPAYLADFRSTSNSIVQVRATNSHDGVTAGAAVIASTGHGFAAVLQTYGENFAGAWSGIALRRWAQVRADSNLNGMIVSTGGADPLVLGTNNAERVRVTSDGKVGIGTDTPSSQLTVFNRIGISVLRLLGPNAQHAGARINFGDGEFPFIAEHNTNELLLGGDAIDFSGRIEIDGVSPIIIRRMEDIDGYADTGIPTAYYKCVATSWAAQYNVRQDDTGINAVWVWDDGTGTWQVAAQFHSEINHDLPDVDIVCFREELVDYVGDDFVWDPD